MEVKPGYKRTEVGVIPEEWEISTVGSEYEIKLGKMLDSEKNVGVPKPYLGNRAVQWTGLISAIFLLFECLSQILSDFNCVREIF